MYLIFAFLFGLSYGVYTRKTHSACYDTCPAGYYKTDDCLERGKPHRCEMCRGNTFTDIPNNTTKCEMCSPCRSLEKEIEACRYNSNTKCDCLNGRFYYRDPSYGDCRPCPSEGCGKDKNHDDYRDCRKKCKSHSSTMSTPKDPLTPKPGPSITQSQNRPEIEPFSPQSIHWFYLVAAAIVTLLVLSWILLLNRNPLRYLTCCPSWCTNKDLEVPVEDPITDEQHSHQGCSPTTVTPSSPLSQSPATRGHSTPACISPLYSDTEWKALRQDEQSEHWPAIVLYAIIKEVPLRRWKEFLRLLSVPDQQLERVELEAGLGMGSLEKQYQMLRLWSQRPSANLRDVFSALHYMNLSGCAQLIQETLENLQHRT